MSDHLDRLRDAVQDYARAEHSPELVVTDFALSFAAIDMHSADTEAFVASAASGAPHATIGLAHILVRDLTPGLDEDGDA